MPPFSYSSGLYAFEWDAEPHLNHPALESPIPCRAGYNCTYSGVCSFVHPGEEGIGRRIFPARSPNEKDVVRLFGIPEKKATFYERRRLRLSWSQWCERVGWQPPAAPVRLDCAPVRLDCAPAPSHRRRERIDIQSSATYGEKIQPPLPPSPPPAQAQPMIFFSSEESLKNYLGEFLYKEVDVRLAEPEAQEIMKKVGWAGSPGKITGMILAGLEISEILELFTNAVLLNDYILEALDTLKSADPLGCALGIPAH
jgi:hypothetical protein